MTIGGLKVGVTPLDMAHAYETIAHDGRRVSGTLAEDGAPVGIQEVASPQHPLPDGSHRDVNQVVSRPVLPPSVAATETEMLETVLQYGTAKAAALGEFAAGKTGTTSNYGDAWFVGWNHKYTVAVWVGYPNSLVPMTTQFDGDPGARGHVPRADLARLHDLGSAYRQGSRRTGGGTQAGAQTDGKTHGQSTTSVSEETAASANGSAGASQSGEEGAERHASPHTGAGASEHSSPPAGHRPRPRHPPRPPRARRKALPRPKVAAAARARKRRAESAPARRARARDVRVAGDAETPRQLDCLGDADPPTGHYRLLALIGGCADHDRAAAQIAPVLRQSDAQRLGELARPEHSSVSPIGLPSPAPAPFAARRARICSIPSSGSSARISTAAPTPSGSQTALSSA